MFYAYAIRCKCNRTIVKYYYSMKKYPIFYYIMNFQTVQFSMHNKRNVDG